MYIKRAAVHFKTARLDPLMVAVERHPPRLPLSQSTETEELMKLNDNIIYSWRTNIQNFTSLICCKEDCEEYMYKLILILNKT